MYLAKAGRSSSCCLLIGSEHSQSSLQAWLLTTVDGSDIYWWGRDQLECTEAPTVRRRLAVQQTFLCLPCLLHVKNRGKHWGQSLQLRPDLALPHQYPNSVLWDKLMTLGLRILSGKTWQTSGVLSCPETPSPTEDRAVSSLRQHATWILLPL